MKRLYHASSAASTPHQSSLGYPTRLTYPGVTGTCGTGKMHFPIRCTKRPMGGLFTISPVIRDRLVGRLRHTCRV